MRVIFQKTFFIVSILAFLGVFAPALAQTPAGDLHLTTSPLPINLKIMPGNSATATLKVKNDGTQSENIKVSLMKFKADSTTGAPILSDREKGDEYFDWVTFSDQAFPLPVNEWKTITASFNVPKEASFDYYYAIVFARADQTVPTGNRQTVLNGGTATLVLLEAVVPDAKREIQVTDFSVNKSMFEFLPATFTVKLRNIGNVHIVPRGNIFISKGSQKDIAIIEVNPNQGSILPDSPRDFQSQWTDGFPVYTQKMQDGKAVLDDKGKQVQELKWDFKDASKLRWGHYTAKLLLVYDDGHRDVPVEVEVSFWVVPWRMIGIFLFNFTLILGLVLYIIRLRRRLKKISKK